MQNRACPEEINSKQEWTLRHSSAIQNEVNKNFIRSVTISQGNKACVNCTPVYRENKI